jgi:hypothetical protein
MTGKKESAEWDEIVGRIRGGQGLTRAAEICKQYAEQAEKTAAEMACDSSPLIALCKLPVQCLTPLYLVTTS